jgi:hypothetical protein
MDTLSPPLFYYNQGLFYLYFILYWLFSEFFPNVFIRSPAQSLADPKPIAWCRLWDH